jgi:hypothetical protein
MLRSSGDCGPLLDFDDVHRLLRLGPRTDIGVREIEIEQVIGSVGRTHEFDGCFRPRTARLRGLLEQIRANQPDAADRAILVHQVDHAYFVVDGHKRLSLAIAEGRRQIDAEVGQYTSPFHLERGATVEDLELTDRERRLRESTGLAAADPSLRMPLCDPVGYLELAESIKSHAYDLSRDRGAVVAPAEAAGHWLDTVFRPVVEIARDAHLDRLLASCNDADLFLLIRRGFTGDMDPGWQVPKAFERHAEERVREATPGRLGAVVGRVTRRPKAGPSILPESDVEPERSDPSRPSDRQGPRSG